MHGSIFTTTLAGQAHVASKDVCKARSASGQGDLKLACHIRNGRPPPSMKNLLPQPCEQKSGNGRPDHTQSKTPCHRHTHTHLLQPLGVKVEDLIMAVCTYMNIVYYVRCVFRLSNERLQRVLEGFSRWLSAVPQERVCRDVQFCRDFFRSWFGN